jgi:hypothetical protein
MPSYGSDGRGWPDEQIDVPPHGLDLDAIVQVGRRQVRNRRMAVVGGTAALLAAVAAIPAAVPLRLSGGDGDVGGSPATSGPLTVLDCDITVLPLPEEFAEPGPDTFPAVQLTAMDPTGRYAVGNAYQQTREEDGSISSLPDGVVLWEDGHPTVPPALRGVNEARDVNADGVVVGGGDTVGSPDTFAWTYHDGEVTELPIPEGFASAEARAINAAGDVVGTGINGDGLHTVLVWPAGDPDHPRLLAAPPGHAAVASGITDEGVVVGESSAAWDADRTHETAVYLWEPDGTRVVLPVPERAVQARVTAVRGDWAVGVTGFETDEPQPSPAPPTPDNSVSLLWDLDARTLRLTGGNGASGVNAAGDVLYGEGPGETPAPAVIRDGEAYFLPDPIAEGAIAPPDTVYTPYVELKGITDDGATIAGSVYINGTPAGITEVSHPVMWHC